MAKNRHLTPAEINYKEVFERAVAIEVRRQMEEVTMDERVVRSIRATHKADLMLALIVLLDVYDARPEFCKEFLDKWTELLKQYDDGTVVLKQLEGHIELRTGIDIIKYVESNMKLADIKEKTDEEETVSV